MNMFANECTHSLLNFGSPLLLHGYKSMGYIIQKCIIIFQGILLKITGLLQEYGIYDTKFINRFYGNFTDSNIFRYLVYTPYRNPFGL